MCDKYAITEHGSVYQAHNRVTNKWYARFKAAPRHWRQIKRSETLTVDNETLIDTLEAAVCEHVTPRHFAAPRTDRPRLISLPQLGDRPRPRRREWRGETK